MPPAKPATIAPWPGWVFQGSGDLPRCLRRWWLGNRRVAGADQFRSAPVHRSESPTGYSSAGCSPAEPASASPVTDNSSSIPIRRGNQMRCSTSLQGCSPGRARRARRQRGVSSLLCAPGDISILRRHSSERGNPMRDVSIRLPFPPFRRAMRVADPNRHTLQ